MGFFNGIGTKLLAGLGFVLGILVVVGRLIGVAQKAERANQLEKQREIEDQTSEALENEKRKSSESLEQARANVDRGDYRDFNAD